MILPLALSASLPVVTGGEFFSPPREFMKVPPTYLQIVVGKGESDKGDLADLSFKGSRSGLALLASVSFKMEFRIPILSQEAYSDTQRESTLENFEELRLKVSRRRKHTIATIFVGEPRQRYFLQRYFLRK